MKKSLLLLLSLLSISCSNYRLIKLNENQTAIKFKTSTIEVDNELLEYVIEFVDEAQEHGIQVEDISRTYLGIYCDEIPLGMVGVTNFNFPYNSYSMIDCENIKSNNKLRIAVFHEMGHKYITWGHCHTFCDQIMTSMLNDKGVYNDWEHQKEVLFNNLEHKGFNLTKDE